jgi:hypothetical protein
MGGNTFKPRLKSFQTKEILEAFLSEKKTFRKLQNAFLIAELVENVFRPVRCGLT